MANLSITSVCNRDCPYCFAMQTLEAGNTPREMSLDTFHTALNFLSRSGIKEVRLLGGEPTLHSRFTDMLAIALQRGFCVLVFSGGLIPRRVLDALAQVPADRLSVLVNTCIPGEDSDAVICRQHKALRELGDRAMLGVNIYTPAIRPGFLLDWIEEFNLRRAVRLGIAHPIWGGDNRYLHPRHYPEVGRRVAAFALECRFRQIDIEFDCGWVPCMFPPGALETLGITASEVGLRCNPIIDVLADGDVISCYPLANHHRESLIEATDAAALRRRFNNAQSRDRAFLLYQECETCEWRKRGECSGGCLSASLRRLRLAKAAGTPDSSKNCDTNRSFYELPVIEPTRQFDCASKTRQSHAQL